MTRRMAALPAALLVAAVVLPIVLSDYRTGRLAAVGAYFIAILGLDLLLGRGRQVSLGHGGFMALGAYTTMILVARHGLRDVATIPVAACVAGAAGLVVALPSLRLRGIYFALATFGLAVSIPPLAQKFDGLTGGSTGIAFYGSSHETGSGGSVRLVGLSLSHTQWTYALTWAIAAALFPFAWWVARKRRPTTLLAVASAAYAGVAGSLVAIDLAFFSPNAIPLEVSLYLAAAATLGLYGSIWGALLGAFVVEYLGDLVGQIPRVPASGPGPTTFVFGALLVAFVLARPLVATISRRKLPWRGERS